MDPELEQVYGEYFELLLKQMAEGKDPLACAGSMMAIAVRLYKTVLDDEAFLRMIDAVPNQKNVKPFNDTDHPIDSTTFH